MRDTNNSMGSLLEDHAPPPQQHQKDDNNRLSHAVSPSNVYSKTALEAQQMSGAPPSHPLSQSLRGQAQFKHSRRTFWIVIQDIQAFRHFHKHEDYKYRTAKSCVHALDLLICQYDLQHKNRAGAICRPSGEDLRKTVQQCYVIHKPEGPRTSKTPWFAGKQDWNAGYLSLIQEVCKDLTLDESLPIYDPTVIEPFNHHASRQGEDGRSRLRRVEATEDKQSDRAVTTKVQGNLATEVDQPALDSIPDSPLVVVSPLPRSTIPELHRLSCIGPLEVS
jgi:hypothetical protein